jgi:hypothetical protein
MDGLITKKVYKDKIQRGFEAYHRLFPGNYQLWVRFAQQAKGAGLTQVSSTTIWERVKWYIDVEHAGDPLRRGYNAKMSNSYRSRYARLIMQQEPDLAGFFPLRELVSVY